MPETTEFVPPHNVDLVLANTVSRLGCTVEEARNYIAEKMKAAGPKAPALPAKGAQIKPSSKNDADALL